MKRQLLLSFLTLASIFTNCQATAKLYVNGNEPKLTISRHIYGHFSEHLGRCIYDGYWVSDT